MFAKKLAPTARAEAQALRLPLLDRSELLTAFLAAVPASLALREIHRALALLELLKPLQGPATVLDVGCGDGTWWECMRAEAAAIYGIDIAEPELALAKSRLDAVAKVDISSPEAASQMAAAGWPRSFDLVIGNCSLEHIPDLDAALATIHQLVAKRGYFILFVPTPTWALQGHLLGYLARRFPRLALALAGAFDGFFQHRHLMDAKLWTRLLKAHGYEVMRTEFMGGRAQEFAFRLGLPTALLSFVCKVLTGHYPNRYSPGFLKRWVRKCMERYVFHDKFAVFAPPHERDTAYEYAFLCQVRR